MQRVQLRSLTRNLGIVVISLALSLIGLSLTRAQGGISVTINGTLQAINGDGTLVVDGETYRLEDGVSLPASAQIGTIVVLGGQYTNDSTLIIISVSVAGGTPAATADTSATATPTLVGTEPATPLPDDGDVIVVVEGPVRVININVITIYDIDVLVAADNPLLMVIHIGDFIRTRGHFDGKGVLIASFVTNVLDPASVATVSLDGKVQAINGNVIVINDMNVQIDPGNIILTKLKVGDVLHVDGNFRQNGPTFIIIVINIVIVNDVTVIHTGLPPGCKMSKNGKIKCSKKHK
jgi:hypothetical protein